jgi:O-antigen/teichoic acid export membrane protein
MKLSRGKRDLIIISTGRLTASFLAVVSIRLLTAYLSPEQYGSLSLLLSIQAFCGLFLVNPIGQYVNLKTHAWWERGLLFAMMRAYSSYIFIVASLAGLIACFLNIKEDVNPAALFFAVSFLVLTATWNSTLVPMLNMLGFRIQSTILAVVTLSISLFSAAFLLHQVSSPLSWLGAQSIGYAVGALAAWSILGKLKPSQTDSTSDVLMPTEVLKRYCFPLALSTGLMWIQTGGYRFIIEWYWGLEALGLLVLGFQIASQIFTLGESVATQYMYPLFFKSIAHDGTNIDSRERYADILNILLPQFVMLASFTISISPLLLHILAGKAYQGAYIFVCIGAMAELLRVATNLFANAVQITRNTFSLVLPYLFGSLLIVLLLPIAGFIGSSIYLPAILVPVGYLTTFLFSKRSMYNQVPFSLDSKSLLLSFFFSVPFVMVVFVTNSPLDYPSSILLIGLLFLLASLSSFFLFSISTSFKRLLANSRL